MMTHVEEYNFHCTEPGCEKKFKQGLFFDKNIFFCGIFFTNQFDFNLATSLKLHIRTHSKEQPYKCEDCDRSFAQLISYRNHRLIHTDEKPFQCSYAECARTFRHRNSLKRHLQTHTGVKPFECHICYKRLSQASSLAAHLKKHEQPKKS